MMDAPVDRFVGCLQGVLLGDAIGAVVESESQAHVRAYYSDIDALLAQDTVPDILDRKWQVGRCTDDTLMTVAVAEWLLDSDRPEGQDLLRRFCECYHPARRFGSGIRWIFEAFPGRESEWKSLATIMFPEGSWGNGSAMRVAPVGLLCYRDPERLLELARLSSLTTHAHPLAIQGATLQAVAVATAARRGTALRAGDLLDCWRSVLKALGRRGDVSRFSEVFRQLEEGYQAGVELDQMALKLGTGVPAIEAVPTALYCCLRNLGNFEKTISDAVFLGGDTDTIAAMAGAIMGACAGRDLPQRWLSRVREEVYHPARMELLGQELAARAG